MEGLKPFLFIVVTFLLQVSGLSPSGWSHRGKISDSYFHWEKYNLQFLSNGPCNCFKCCVTTRSKLTDRLWMPWGYFYWSPFVCRQWWHWPWTADLCCRCDTTHGGSSETEENTRSSGFFPCWNRQNQGRQAVGGGGHTGRWHPVESLPREAEGKHDSSTMCVLWFSGFRLFVLF